MNVSTQTRPYPWLIVISGSLIALMTFGPRSAMGFFQLPMLSDMGWDRSTFGFAIALQNFFWGFGQPFFGALADRYGTGRVLALSGILYASGLLVAAHPATPLWLHIGAGVLVGLGIAAGSYSVILSAFARNVTPSQQSFVFGIGAAAGSAGMFIFAPLSQFLINVSGWSMALTIMALLMLAIPVLAIPLRGNRHSGAVRDAGYEQTVRQALTEALGHKSYLLLAAGFFVCGFQIAFITAHFPAYLLDIGIDARYAVIAMALIGAFNIIGSLAAGAIGQVWSKVWFLSLIYIGRSIAIIAFLIMPQTPLTVILFAIVMGLLWLSTVPPTNGLVAIMFGTRHLGLLGGLVFFSHQLGSFLGVWLGAYLYDRLGSFEMSWWISVGLGIVAAFIHLPIRESLVEGRPVAA